MSTQVSKTVLLVDDSKLALRIFRKYLDDTEFDVVGEAQNGAEAVEQYQKLSPDLVLLDIVMPGDDGEDVLRTLRGMDPLSRVVMVSSLGTKERVMSCLKAGAKSFLAKPFERDGLLDILRTVAAES